MKRLAKKVEREKIVLAALPQLSVRIIEPALRTRKSHHQRHRTTNGYEQKHIEATLPPVGRRRPSYASRQRAWRVVRIALRRGLLAIARGVAEARISTECQVLTTFRSWVWIDFANDC